jgi:hypothetical protein
MDTGYPSSRHTAGVIAGSTPAGHSGYDNCGQDERIRDAGWGFRRPPRTF